MAGLGDWRSCHNLSSGWVKATMFTKCVDSQSAQSVPLLVRRQRPVLDFELAFTFLSGR